MTNLPTYQFKGQIVKTDSKVYPHVIYLDKACLKFIENHKIKRLIVTYNNGDEQYTGFMPAGEGKYFLIFNKALMKSVGVQPNDFVDLTIKEDTSKYGMPLSEEFESLLEIDLEFGEYFDQLTPGKRRTLIHMVNSFKSSEVRIEKSLVIADHIKVNKGKLDFKQLYQAFKNYKY